MRLIGLPVILAISLFAAPLANAQQAGQTPRIGFLRMAAPPESYIEAFRQGLKERGYIEGKNIAFEYRWGGGRTDQLPELAAELVRLKVDVVVVEGAPPALAARKASITIPIVMASSGDPVGTGLIASLARPGGNVTGVSLMMPELGGKRLELLREVVPSVTRVAFLAGRNPLGRRFVEEAQVAGQTLGLRIQPVMVGGLEEFEAAFSAMVRERAGALIVQPIFISSHARRIVDIAARHRMPTISDVRELPDAGGLMSYGPNVGEAYRRAATYVDRILKGAKPADLPVEQPTKFELVINLKTAKALGITVPHSLLLRADEVIQ